MQPSSSNTSKSLTAIIAIILILYPACVYWGLAYFETRHLTIMLFVIFMLRFVMSRKLTSQTATSSLVFIATAGGVLCLFAGFLNNSVPLKFYPLIVNIVLAGVFFVSLIRPPTIIEKIARIRHPNLSATGVRHTRRTTIAWLAFFLINGSISAYTIFFSSMKNWALYNGFISYILIALLFAGEYLIRLRVIKQENASKI